MDQALAVNFSARVRNWWSEAWASTRGRVLIGACTSLLALFVGFWVLKPKEAGFVVRVYGYYVITAAFLIWLFAMARLLVAERPWRRLQAARGILVVATSLTVIASTTVPYGYKVLFDEAVIQGTALNMASDRAVGVIGRAYELGGQLHVVDDYLDKRPVFFPYLVSLMHITSGVRETNAFALNTVCYFASVFLAGIIGRRVGGRNSGILAALSLGAFSLMAVNATGAGLELLNLTLILLLAWAGGRYLENPDGARLGLVVLTAVLLANTRYESGVYVAIAGLVMIEGWRRRGHVIVSAGVVVSPLLLLPYAWQTRYVSDTPALWELSAGKEHRFSLEYLTDNLESAARFFTAFDSRTFNSPWLTWAGGGAFVIWAFHRLRGRVGSAAREAAVISAAMCGLGVVATTALLLSYYWGNLNDPIVARLSLPLHAMLAVLVGGVLGAMSLRRKWILPVAAGMCLTSYLAWGIPANHKIPRMNLIENAQRWELEEVRSRGAMTRLIITEKSPLFWFSQGTSSVSVNLVRGKLESLRYHFQRRSFDEILVMQRLGPTGMDGRLEVEEGSRLPEEIQLETVAETRFGLKLQRISRVVDVRPQIERSATPRLSP